MCNKPCNECPYRKQSIPGYFGGHDGNQYRSFISQDTTVACHTRTKFNDNGDPRKISYCTGHIAAQIKSCKSPIPNTLPHALHQAMRDRSDFDVILDNALSIFDFNAHHNLG